LSFRKEVIQTEFCRVRQKSGGRHERVRPNKYIRCL
jgi:hypothetical protein